MAKTTEDKFKLKEQVAAKAWSDDGFRKELMADPKAALKKLLGEDLPENLKVNILLDTPKKMNLVLQKKAEGGELSESELASVSGGGWGCFCFCDCFTLPPLIPPMGP